eukprot:jgi/Mesvir1/3493/Mv11981-RA.1
MAQYDETIWKVKQIYDYKPALVDVTSTAGVTKDVFKPGIREEFAKRPLFARDIADLALGDWIIRSICKKRGLPCPDNSTAAGKADIAEYNRAKMRLFSQDYVECEGNNGKPVRLKEAELLWLCVAKYVAKDDLQMLCRMQGIRGHSTCKDKLELVALLSKNDPGHGMPYVAAVKEEPAGPVPAVKVEPASGPIPPMPALKAEPAAGIAAKVQVKEEPRPASAPVAASKGKEEPAAGPAMMRVKQEEPGPAAGPVPAVKVKKEPSAGPPASDGPGKRRDGDESAHRFTSNDVDADNMRQHTGSPSNGTADTFPAAKKPRVDGQQGPCGTAGQGETGGRAPGLVGAPPRTPSNAAAPSSMGQTCQPPPAQPPPLSTTPSIPLSLELENAIKRRHNTPPAALSARVLLDLAPLTLLSQRCVSKGLKSGGVKAEVIRRLLDTPGEAATVWKAAGFTVRELQEVCRAKGLRVTGSWGDLVMRVEQADGGNAGDTDKRADASTNKKEKGADGSNKKVDKGTDGSVSKKEKGGDASVNKNEKGADASGSQKDSGADASTRDRQAPRGDAGSSSPAFGAPQTPARHAPGMQPLPPAHPLHVIGSHIAQWLAGNRIALGPENPDLSNLGGIVSFVLLATAVYSFFGVGWIIAFGLLLAIVYEKSSG